MSQKYRTRSDANRFLGLRTLEGVRYIEQKGLLHLVPDENGYWQLALAEFNPMHALRTNGTNAWRTFETARAAAEVNLKAIAYRLSGDALAAAIAQGVIRVPRARLGSAGLRMGTCVYSRAGALPAMVLVARNKLSRTAPESLQRSQ